MADNEANRIAAYERLISLYRDIAVIDPTKVGKMASALCLKSDKDFKDLWACWEIFQRDPNLQAFEKAFLEKSLLAEPEGASATLGEIMRMMTALLHKLDITAGLQLLDFRYTASKASASRQSDDFKEGLEAFYDNIHDDRHQLRCMLLNVELPKRLVTGAHLFKYSWAAKMTVIMGQGANVNDPRNGLLLFKPLEHAFDDSRICFLYRVKDGEPQFVLELLDPKLKEVKVWDYATDNKLTKGYTASQLHEKATSVTFGQLQGVPLTFTNGNYPWKRCLSFQAQQASRRAISEGWLPADWKPLAALSYASEDAKVRLDSWLSAAAGAPPPPDSEPSED